MPSRLSCDFKRWQKPHQDVEYIVSIRGPPGSQGLCIGKTSEAPDMIPAVTDSALAGLDPEQQSAVTAPPGPVCILAGAGTGKTRAITHRIAHRVQRGEIHPQHVLAVTFTARAAAEMRGRL